MPNPSNLLLKSFHRQHSIARLPLYKSMIIAAISCQLSVSSCIAGEITDQGKQPSVEQLQQLLIDLEQKHTKQIQALKEQVSQLAKQASYNQKNTRNHTKPTDNVSQLSISGDARLRYENTSDHNNDRERNRGVMRARLSAQYTLSDHLTIGGRLVTGSEDDPNSTDVSMGSFVNDLTISLDQAYARYQSHGAVITGGKFSNPLIKTDLVWDGDVNPYGITGSADLFEHNGFLAKLTGIYTIIDEQTNLDDSYMAGAQLSLTKASTNWSASLSTAYYDYSIGSLLNADSGDTRDNNLNLDSTAYLSGFELFDTIIQLQFKGIGHAWPVKLTLDYVKNMAANVAEDSGVEVDVSVGKSNEIGDWKVSYGYSINETDAVLTAFSHDNTTYASNYKQHALSIDYTATENTQLNLTGYHYRRDKFVTGYADDWDDYVSRIRLNLSFSF